jgi:hypothetical protein
VSWFNKSREPELREPTCEEMRRLREKQLRANLDRVNAEAEELSARLTEFLFTHKTPHGDYFGASLEELGRLPDQERSLRNQEFLLNEQRNRILKELADLTVNAGESRHIAGVLDAG